MCQTPTSNLPPSFQNGSASCPTTAPQTNACPLSEPVHPSWSLPRHPAQCAFHVSPSPSSVPKATASVRPMFTRASWDGASPMRGLRCRGPSHPLVCKTRLTVDGGRRHFLCHSEMTKSRVTKTVAHARPPPTSLSFLPLRPEHGQLSHAAPNARLPSTCPPRPELRLEPGVSHPSLPAPTDLTLKSVVPDPCPIG